MRRRQPRWVVWLLAALLLCQQVALAAHVCDLPAPPVAGHATSDCMQSMDGDGAKGIDCAAHCADPAKHGQDGVALAVPPLLRRWRSHARCSRVRRRPAAMPMIPPRALGDASTPPRSC